MWIPVLEVKMLKDKPLRVFYWGVPVVLFKTESGQIGALEDRCAHRQAPLSRGQVKGETILCSYHHFGFNLKGNCKHIPNLYECTSDFQKNCNPVINFIANNFFKKFIHEHLSQEDSEVLSMTQSETTEKMKLTSVDNTVVSQRAMFERYLNEKAHLFPENSLIHKIQRLTKKTEDVA